MTIGAYVTIANDIAQRLIDNVADVYVQVGSKDDRIFQDQEKYCAIMLTGIDENYGQARQYNRKDGAMSFTISCMKATLADSQSSAVDSGDIVDDTGAYLTDDSGVTIMGFGGNGFMPFIEEVLDAINTKADGTTLDPQIEDAATSMKISVGNIQYGRDRIWFDVSIDITSKPFTINNRRRI